MVIAAITVIGTVALLDRDVAAVSSAILTVLVALGLAELREIKSQTNGNSNTLMEQNRVLMQELAQYRRDAANITNRALDSAPLATANPGTSTTTTTSTTTRDDQWPGATGPSSTT
jgi:hypothetical protein